MSEWVELIVGESQVMPEMVVLVRLIGALLLLEVATMTVALLSGVTK